MLLSLSSICTIWPLFAIEVQTIDGKCLHTQCEHIEPITGTSELVLKLSDLLINVTPPTVASLLVRFHPDDNFKPCLLWNGRYSQTGAVKHERSSRTAMKITRRASLQWPVEGARHRHRHPLVPLPALICQREPAPRWDGLNNFLTLLSNGNRAQWSPTEPPP